ncbi:MAG: choice-of-anchor tandem repeat GloVer-containing protein [Candidatus Cybelea sp.]
MRTRSFSVVAAVALIMAAGCAQLTRSQIIPTNALELALKHKSGVVETVLYSFGTHGLDGAWPRAGLIDVKGTLYGTTFTGGTHRRGRVCGQNDGCGTVFSITTSGSEKVTYGLFAGGPRGANPAAGLINVNGRLYGTTAYGGANECPDTGWGCGTVFSVTTTGTEKVLHRFNGSNGEFPQAGLIYVNGTFYGTTAVGGASAYGTVFSIMPTGTYHLLYSFAGGHDGDYPDAGLTNVGGKLYGTTSGGGKYGRGTVFSITTSGSEKMLHAFTLSDGNNPEAGLIYVKGKLYGTTIEGGHSQGTVFSITTTGTEKVLYRFAGGSDGAQPSADLVNDNGTLYGTTENGGGTSCGCGTVFSITTAGAETVLHSFTGGSTADGAYPEAGLIYLDGTLYGTTASGGSYGDGTVFTITGPRL